MDKSRTETVMRDLFIPIQGYAWPLLRIAFPMTEDAWMQMMAVLIAMKPGLVEEKEGMEL